MSVEVVHCWPNLTAIIQSLRLSIFGLVTRMHDDADAKVILTAPPPGNWKRPPGRPRVTWLNVVQRYLRAYNLTPNEAVDLAQNCLLWRLISTPSGACQKRRKRVSFPYVDTVPLEDPELLLLHCS